MSVLQPKLALTQLQVSELPELTTDFMYVNFVIRSLIDRLYLLTLNFFGAPCLRALTQTLFFFISFPFSLHLVSSAKLLLAGGYFSSSFFLSKKVQTSVLCSFVRNEKSFSLGDRSPPDFCSQQVNHGAPLSEDLNIEGF